jgi:hypothetical protein
MKIAITGHTSGLGLAFYNHFSKENEVIGLSRSNGYDITKDQDRIIDTVKDCELFFNNAYSGIYQAVLLSKLYQDISIITSGSMAADYSQSKNSYYQNKKKIEDVHKLFVKKGKKPLLLLKMGYLENYQDRPSIRYQEVINAVEFWLKNSRVTLIEFDNII